MKTKLIILLAVFLSLNFSTAHELKVEAKEPVTKQFDLNREFKIQSMKSKLPGVINRLTDRAYKTSYVYSGSSIHGWDCSGMVRWTYQQIGITLPHSADKQAHLGKRVSNPKRGDIVVFAYKGRTDFYHSGIYLGHNLIINANLEYGTTIIQPLTAFKNSQIRFVRVLP